MQNNFLFEINHPCHAHLFKNVITSLLAYGNHVDVYVKKDPITESILLNENIKFKLLPANGTNLFFKLIRQIYVIFKYLLLSFTKKYTLLIGVSSTIALISKLTSLHSLVLDDDDKKATPLFSLLAHSNASVLLRPKCLSFEGFFENTIYHYSYHALVYLHPKLFKPNIIILKEQGLHENDIFFIIRLSALKAHHDIGKKGISNKDANKIIEILKKYGKIIILEEKLSTKYSDFSLNIPPEKLHDLMAFSKLVISDGQTMCSEAACLGIPSIRINDFVGEISYLKELENKWGLSFGFKPNNIDAALKEINSIIKTPSDVFQKRNQLLINNSINLSSFLEWFIINYPNSVEILNENPDYQYRFK